MKPITLPFAKRAQPRMAKRPQRPNAPRIDRLSHELVNQLSIIMLTCFKLSESLTGKLERGEMQNLQTLESAVQEVGELVDQIAARLQNKSPTGNFALNPSSNNNSVQDNVYPIAPRLR
jgi:hypothetical protein